MHVAVLGAHPVLHDVLHLKRLVAKLSASLGRMLLVEVLNLLLQRRVYLNVVVGARAEGETRPSDRHRRRIVSRALHLVDIPVGLQIREVAHTCVGTESFGLLIIPQRERVVVAIGEDNRVALVLKRHQIVLSEVAAGVASAAVVVVPSLRSHLYRYEQTGHAYHAGKSHIIGLELLLEHIVESQHTKTAPYSECVERAGISIVALTGLLRSLVKIEHDGKTGHEEEEEHHPELADATLSAPSLPEESDKSQQQRQTVEHVVSLVVLQLLRQLALVAKHPVVDKRDARYPVAVLGFSTTLHVVLSSGKVPHEVAPVHEVTLVREEESYVVPLCRHLHGHLLATAVVGHVSTRNATQPALISLSVSRRMHTWEQHVLSVNELVLV